MKQISIGTYSINGNANEVIKTAYESNITHFDTAPNYRHGEAHSLLNSAAKQLHTSSNVTKNKNMYVTTKIGYIPQSMISKLIQEHIISPEDVFENNCLSNKYVEYQLNQNLTSLKNVVVESILLHNPEVQVRHLTSRDFTIRITKTFEILEEAVVKGQIKDYGVATWHGFNGSGLDIQQFLGIAQNVAGSNHHFRVIQLPLSMVNITPLYEAHCHYKGILREARDAGLKIQASSPLHRGELPKLISPELANIIRKNVSPAIACYLFTFSSPYVDRMLTSPSNVTQFQDLLDIKENSLLSPEELSHIIKILMKQND